MGTAKWVHLKIKESVQIEFAINNAWQTLSDAIEEGNSENGKVELDLEDAKEAVRILKDAVKVLYSSRVDTNDPNRKIYRGF